MLEILEETAGDLVAFRIKGRYLQEDAHKLVEILDARIEHSGHVRCLAELQDMHGVDFGSVREELGFDLKHGNQIERCAVVGNAPWERWLVTTFGLIFRKAETRLFLPDQRDAALAWVRETA
jgi:hypothetical protein